MSSIGETASKLGISTHTLRYYEKIGLLPPVAKSAGGRRVYTQVDLDRVQFIKRAQRMHFSLDEIRSLIALGQGASVEKPSAQRIVEEKLHQVEDRLKDLRQLKTDLSRMLSDCKMSRDDDDCPIIEGIKQD